MRKNIINFVKYHPVVRKLYRFFGNTLLIIFGSIVRIQPHRILFSSFGGRKYDDSPRAIYERLKSDSDFENWEFIWAFVNPTEFPNINCKKVRMDTFSYFYYALSSKIWITNTSIERGLRFKKRNIICVNTWHGTPFKKLGSYKSKNRIDILCVQNFLDEKVFRRIFDVKYAEILKSDLPRNDALFSYTKENIQEIRNKLNIASTKKVLLYMPTYREYLEESNKYNEVAPPIDYEKFERILSNEYVLLVRFHYLVDRAVVLPQMDFIKNVTNYPTLSDLYIVTDILISDYSSCYFDFSILQRPMECFAYDYEEYKYKRGFEVDLKQELPCEISRTDDELLKNIQNINWAESIKRAKQFHEEYTPYAGNATSKVVEALKRRLNSNIHKTN